MTPIKHRWDGTIYTRMKGASGGRRTGAGGGEGGGGAWEIKLGSPPIWGCEPPNKVIGKLIINLDFKK